MTYEQVWTFGLFMLGLGAFLVALAMVAEIVGNWLYGPEREHWNPGDRPEDWWK